MDQQDRAGSGHFSTDLLWRITQEAGEGKTEKIERECTERRRTIEGNVREWCPTSLMLLKSVGGSCDSSFQFIVAPLPKLFARIIPHRSKTKNRRIS